MRALTRCLAGFAAAALAPAFASFPAEAQLAVAVTTNVVDEDDPSCFMHGTQSVQAVDVTNQGAVPAVATLHCSVPSGLLRVTATSLATTIEPGAIARLECSLYDFGDPPVDGSTVDFDVDVNGAVTTHTAQVSCRQAPAPAERCAAARLGAVAAACRSELAAHAAFAASGDAGALSAALERSAAKLDRKLGRIAAKAPETCPAAGAGERAAAILDAVTGEAAALAETLDASCAGDALDALARKCAADVGAWARFARSGSSAKLEAALARNDASYERRYARSCAGSGSREALRTAAEAAVEGLRTGEGLDVADLPAELFRGAVTFAKGEREKRVWIPMLGDGAVLFELADGLHATLHGEGGAPAGTAGEVESPLAPAATALDLPAGGHVPVAIRRSGDIRKQRTVTALLTFDDPAAAFVGTLGFFSPLRTFFGGEDVHDVPVGYLYDDFSDYVLGEWGYDLSFGREALEWYSLEALFFGLCPAAAPAATPPPGASHNANECGISTFIHSMQGQFPGALAPDVATNPKRWDEIGDLIGHSNTYGTPLLGKNVSEGLSGASTQLDKIGPFAYGARRVARPSGTRDGKFYCAGRIGDETPANLAAWNEDCDLKVLVFDLPTFGHWLDVNTVTPDPNDPAKATMQLQDYAKSYDVACTHTPDIALDNTEMDVSVDPAAAGSVLQGNFGAGDPVAGDEIEESVSFWVVCECDRTDPLEPVLPKATKSGKTLVP